MLPDGTTKLCDNVAFMDLEQPQPGVYTFVVSFNPITEPGQYTIRIMGFQDRIAGDDFTVE
jgi:hypothetical protein